MVKQKARKKIAPNKKSLR